MRRTQLRDDSIEKTVLMAMSNRVSVSDTTPANAASAAEIWLAGGKPIALATVIETWGSSPVPIGGQMVIADDDSFQGSVSGGCIEADVIAIAGDVIRTGKPQNLAFGIDDETAWRAGLPCGGKVRILVTRLSPDEGRSFYGRLAQARDNRIAVVISNPLDGRPSTIFSASDAPPGPIAQALESGVSGIVALDDGDAFLQALTPAPRVIVIGATHIGQVLVQLVDAVGYELAVVDPRTAFASPDRFDAARISHDWPRDALSKLKLDSFTAVAVLSHITAIDDEALQSALRAPCRYIGALGSRRTHAKRVDRLKAAGFDDAAIARIRAPIGLDIGAKLPPEIAVAIVADIVAAFRKGRPQ